ncbi:MAG: hypothetical protein KIS91_14755, partial [Anaerolineae bacterium]|nr:hypothetical protein [Anaerolineae bacterium]
MNPHPIARRVVTALALVLAAAFAVAGLATPALAANPVDAKIEIVWPHNNAPVSVANMVNVTAYLFDAGTLNPVKSDFNPKVTLWQALNAEPAQPVADGNRRMANISGYDIPVWDFNDIDVGAAKDPLNKYYFYVTVDGVPANTNVWGHGADGRTYLPEPLLPTAIGSSKPGRVDARFSVLWPHDAAGNQRNVATADLANITARVFESGTTNSVGPDFGNSVKLLRMINNGPAEIVATGSKRLTTDNGVAHPVWDFNDVDVSAARNPANKVYFVMAVDGVSSNSTVWSHAS